MTTTSYKKLDSCAWLNSDQDTNFTHVKHMALDCSFLPTTHLSSQILLPILSVLFSINDIKYVYTWQVHVICSPFSQSRLSHKLSKTRKWALAYWTKKTHPNHKQLKNSALCITFKRVGKNSESTDRIHQVEISLWYQSYSGQMSSLTGAFPVLHLTGYGPGKSWLSVHPWWPLTSSW